MLTRRSTVALVLLFAAGSAQAHTVAAKAHAVNGKHVGEHAASIFKVPVLAQSPMNWGQAPAVAPPLELPSIESAAPGLTVMQSSTMVPPTASADVFSVPVLAQSPLNWGQAPGVASPGVPLLRFRSSAPGLAMARGHGLERISPLPAAATGSTANAYFPTAADAATDLRDALVQLAMSLRDIPYVSGGDTPSAGFDCSGFVRYVFAHVTGMQLPTNAASQFLAGLKVSRGRLKAGDLVFFHTEGRRRISHVGIYLSNGRFIHAPTSGKSVEVSSLHNAYWSRHFAGARRPAAIVAAATNG